MATIAHTLPSGLVMAPATSFTTDMDQRISRSESGRILMRSRGIRTSLSMRLQLASLSQAQAQELAEFLERVRLAGGFFWVVDPLSRQHADLLCSPMTDGTRTTFQIGLKDVVDTDAVVIMVNGIPADPAGYTIHERANVLDDASAIAYGESWISGHCTDEDFDGFGLVSGGCTKAVASGDGSYPYIRAVQTGYANCVTGEDQTMVASVLCKTSKTWRPDILWYDVGPSAYNSASIGSNVDSVDNQWLAIAVTATAAAPEAEARIYLLDSSTTDEFYVGSVSISPGTYSTWHLPSQAPALVQFDTAPAAGSVITATGEGYRVTRMIMDSPPPVGAGEASRSLPSSLNATEAPEVSNG